MKIGILGTGNVATALAACWVGQGHDLKLGARDPQVARAAAATIGPAVGGGSLAEAAAFGDVVLLAVPWRAAQEALGAAGLSVGKVLIDCINPLDPADFTRPERWDATTSAAEQIARWAPGTRVVKAFNVMPARVMRPGKARFGAHRAGGLYCGDDPAAKQAVAALIADAGFEPLDAGPLENARMLEPMALLLIRMAVRGLGDDIAWTLLRR